MKKISVLLTFLILVGIFIPAVSATILYDEEIEEYQFTGESYSISPDPGSYNCIFNNIVFNNIESVSDLSYIAVTCPSGGSGRLPSGVHHQEYWFQDDINNKKQMTIYVSETKNILGAVTSVRYTLFFDEWDIGTRTGQKKIGFNAIESSKSIYNHRPEIKQKFAYIQGDGTYPIYNFAISCGKFARNHITISDEDDGNTLKIDLKRVISGKSSASYIKVFNIADTVIYQDLSAVDLTEYFLKSDVASIELQTVYNHTYAITLAGDQTGTSHVTVYVRNSQTNALIADSHIVISASVDNEFHEVINQTLPSGTYKGILQPTGGGLPNPDFYRLIVTAEGYNSIMPYLDFEFDEAVTIYDYLDPIGGAPQDENNTFIDFFVRDMSANPISGATVNFGGYTLITNSAGYTIFEVDKSKTYSWTVSKSGYGSLTGSVVIGDAPRHTINTVLAPAVTPTIPTPTPTSTPISPTPTMTAPTGEPVSNWLEWFASHFGMILGGGAEIGKIFMWLCFSVPVGVYVGKESKAGAAGFMAGAGIVTLFFVLIGWVPIWLLVLLALIIGLLYAKVFNNSDNGGGR